MASTVNMRAAAPARCGGWLISATAARLAPGGPRPAPPPPRRVPGTPPNPHPRQSPRMRRVLQVIARIAEPGAPGGAPARVAGRGGRGPHARDCNARSAAQRRPPGGGGAFWPRPGPAPGRPHARSNRSPAPPRSPRADPRLPAHAGRQGRRCQAHCHRPGRRLGCVALLLGVCRRQPRGPGAQRWCARTRQPGAACARARRSARPRRARAAPGSRRALPPPPPRLRQVDLHAPHDGHLRRPARSPRPVRGRARARRPARCVAPCAVPPAAAPTPRPRPPPRTAPGGNPDSNTLISDMTTVICLDDYHSLDRKGRSAAGVTALDPKAQHFDLMYNQARARGWAPRAAAFAPCSARSSGSARALPGVRRRAWHPPT